MQVTVSRDLNKAIFGVTDATGVPAIDDDGRRVTLGKHAAEALIDGLCDTIENYIFLDFLNVEVEVIEEIFWMGVE